MMVVSIERHGALAARRALERCVAEAGVALFPADTLYGLACDPSDAAAIERIHEIKGREDDKPSAVMFFSSEAMRVLLSTVGPYTARAIGALLPGPVTVVVDNPAHRYPLAAREDPERLGLRLIDGPLAGARCAVFQTSANRSGEPAPSRFEDVVPPIIAAVDVAIDGGPLGGQPSTVVDLASVDAGGSWRILRHGAMPSGEVGRRLSRAEIPRPDASVRDP
jgi:L-threonylcarbamoyladenylate synthase